MALIEKEYRIQKLERGCFNCIHRTYSNARDSLGYYLSICKLRTYKQHEFRVEDSGICEKWEKGGHYGKGENTCFG